MTVELPRPDAPASLVCRDALDTLRQLPGGVFDGIITDPPYSSGGFTRGDRVLDPVAKYQQSGQGKQWATFGGDSRDQRGYVAWCTQWLSECWRVLKPGGVALVFTDWRQLPVTSDAIQSADFVWRGIVPWDKTEGVRPQMGRFRQQAEYVLWASKGPLPLNRGVGVLPGVMQHANKSSDKHHLTGKPTALMRDLVRIVPEGALVLDPFMGSGTTGVACVESGRLFVGVERDGMHFNTALARIEAAVAARADATREAACSPA